MIATTNWWHKQAWWIVAIVASLLLIAPAFMHTGAILTLDNVAAPGQSVILLGIPLAATAFQRLLLAFAVVPGLIGVLAVARTKSVVTAVVVSLFWITNPFLAERLAVGQWELLVTINLLPWFLLCLASRGGYWRLRALAALVIALVSIGCYPRAVSFFELALIAGGIGWIVTNHSRWKASLMVATSWLLGSIALHEVAIRWFSARLEGDTPLSMQLFALGGSGIHWINFVGFWAERSGRLPANLSETWITLLPALLLLPIAAFGVRAAMRRNVRLGLTVGALYGLSLLLVCLNQSLTQPLVASTIDKLGFIGVREAGKFMGGMLVAEAIALGFGLDALLAQKPRIGWSLTGISGVLLLVLLPTTLSLTEIALRPVTYPPELLNAVAAANRNHETAIVLPWHRYQSYSFTNGRVVDQLAPILFTHTVFNELVEDGPFVTASADPWQIAMLQATTGDTVDASTLDQALNERSITVVVVMKTNDFAKYQVAIQQLGYSVVQDTSALTEYRIVR